MSREFFKDFIRYIPSKLFPGLFGILIIPVLTRIFDPEAYGQYTLVMSTVAVMSIFAADWIGTSVIRFFPEYSEKGELPDLGTTINRITPISVVAVLVASLLILQVIGDRISPELLRFLYVGILIFALGVPFNVLLQVLVARRMPSQYSLFFLWRNIGCIIIGVGLTIVFDLGVVGLLWGMVLGLALGLPFLQKVSLGTLGRGLFRRDLVGNLRSYGFPLVFTNLAGWVLALSDRYIIEAYRGSHEVGLYSISYNIADRTVQLVVTLIVLSSAPIAMAAWESGGATEAAIFVSKLTRYYMILALPAAVGLSILARPILKLLATENYFQGYLVMPLVAGSIFLFGLQRNFQLGLLFHKKTGIIMGLVLAAGLLNIVLNFIFVPRFGFLAAGYTTFVSYFFFAILVVVVSRRFFRWDFPYMSALRITVSAMVMGLVVKALIQNSSMSLPMTLVSAVLLGGATYLVMLFLLAEVSKDTFKEMLNTFRKR